MAEVPGSEFELQGDFAFLAMGFTNPVGSLLDAFGVEKDARGNARATTDGEGCYATNVAKVFAAGDVRRGQSLVVWAIREGRQCGARGRCLPDGQFAAAALIAQASCDNAKAARVVAFVISGVNKWPKRRYKSSSLLPVRASACIPICPRCCTRWPARRSPTHVIDTARALAPERIWSWFMAMAAKRCGQTLDAADISWARQEPQLGTGHAVRRPCQRWTAERADTGALWRRAADQVSTLQRLLRAGRRRVVDPHRRSRQADRLWPHRSRLAREAYNISSRRRMPSAAEKRDQRGQYRHPGRFPRRAGRWLPTLSNDNAQGEYYLTDIVALAVAEGMPVRHRPARCEHGKCRALTASCNWPNWSACISAMSPNNCC